MKVIRDGDFVGVVAPTARAARAAAGAIAADWELTAQPGPAGLEAYLRAHPVEGQGFSAPYRHLHGSPGWLTWASFVGAGVALVLGAIGGRRLPAIALSFREPLAVGAVVLFLLPVAVHGYSHWSPPKSTEKPLPPSLVETLRERLPERSVVFTDAQTGYELAAFVPVYVNATPPRHSSATRANHPALRVRDAQRFFRDGVMSIPLRYGAQWLLVDRARYPRKTFPLQQVYADRRYVLYRLP